MAKLTPRPFTPQVRIPVTILQDAERAPELVRTFRSLLLGFESRIVQPVHYAIPLVHKNVPSPRPPKKVPSDTYSNAPRLCLFTLYELIITRMARGRQCIFVRQLSTELPISHSARYFVNIFARNNDVTVTVTCHSLVKLLEGTMISLFYQIEYAVTVHRILTPNVFFTRESGGGNASSLGNCLISHSARYFVNIFARNNDVTVTVTVTV